MSQETPAATRRTAAAASASAIAAAAIAAAAAAAASVSTTAPWAQTARSPTIKGMKNGVALAALQESCTTKSPTKLPPDYDIFVHSCVRHPYYDSYQRPTCALIGCVIAPRFRRACTCRGYPPAWCIVQALGSWHALLSPRTICTP